MKPSIKAYFSIAPHNSSLCLAHKCDRKSNGKYIAINLKSDNKRGSNRNRNKKGKKVYLIYK